MRRILLLVIGMLALAIAVPSAASAHGRHHHRHHHHKHKAKHARTAHFGGDASSNVDPSGPAGPGDAGTVASFDGTTGVLTITLADGSSVSGKVTADTEIGCVSAGDQSGQTATASHDGGWVDDQGDDDQGDDGDHHGGCQGPSACDASDLVQGAIVHEAILRIGANGAEFKLVVLVSQQATT